MKKTFIVFFIIFSSVIAYSREPVYTIEKAEDGRTIISCPTDDDFLILLYGYNVPDRFYLVVLVRDIYFEKVELFGNVFFSLRGTKLTNARDYGYERDGLSIINTNNYDVRRNTQYYFVLDVEKSRDMSAILGYPVYSSSILGVMDLNLNPVNRL